MIDKLRPSFCVVALVAGAISASACVRAPGAEMARSVQKAAEGREPEKLVEIGDAYASVGDHVRASQYYSLAIEAGSNEAQILPKLLDMCVRDRQFRAALFHLENYIRRHPQDA